MRRVLPMLLGLLVLGARAAAAYPGIDLSWDTCAMTAASGNLSSSCDSNEPDVSHRLVMSFVPSVDIPDFAAVSITLDIDTQAGSLPDWWRFGGGECREGSFSFPTGATSLGSTCTNPWRGWTAGGFALHPGVEGRPNRLRITMDFASLDTLHLLAGVRYVAGVATLDLRRTVADGSGDPVCAGCETPACLILESVQLYGHAPGEWYLLEWQDYRQYVTWQDAMVIGSCYVPTRSSTWGAIKSLYR